MVREFSAGGVVLRVAVPPDRARTIALQQGLNLRADRIFARKLIDQLKLVPLAAVDDRLHQTGESGILDIADLGDGGTGAYGVLEGGAA